MRLGIVFGNQANAQALCDLLDQEMGYPRTVTGRRNGTTVTTEHYTTPRKHPTLNQWAVVIGDWRAAQEVIRAFMRTAFTRLPIDKLGAEWFPENTT